MLNHDRKSPAGCKPFDVVMMFKILLLKRFYNLSDEQAEYQITDRLSFREFLAYQVGIVFLILVLYGFFRKI